jgi:hypothetical protein
LAGILSESTQAVTVLIKNIVFTAFNIRTLNLDTVAYTEIPLHSDQTFLDVIAALRNAVAIFGVEETFTVFSVINALALAVGIECFVFSTLFNTWALIGNAITNIRFKSLSKRTLLNVIALHVTSALCWIVFLIIRATVFGQSTLAFAVVISEIICWTRCCWARIDL